MYLTRTKLLAAGLVLVGILTTGAGVLSKADAQGQPGPSYDEAVRKYYDALRTHPAAKDKWEYKFLPVDKPLSTAELRIVLSRADGEGWTYCGSQDLAADKSGKVTPHMVFKRPAAGGVAEASPATRDSASAALLERVRAQEAEVRLRREEERMKKLAADDQATAERAARDAAARQLETEAKLRGEAERAMKAAAAQHADAVSAVAAAEKALLDQEVARRTELAARKELEALKAQYEKMIQDLQAQLKAKGVQPPPTKANPSNKKPEPQAGNDPFRSTAPAVGPDTVVTAVVELGHADSKAVLGSLGKMAPGVKVVEATPHSITLTGPAAAVTATRDVIRKLIDVKAGQNEVVVVALKHANAAEVAQVLEKVSGSTGAQIMSNAASNSVILSAPPAVLEDLKKVIATLDRPAGAAK